MRTLMQCTLAIMLTVGLSVIAANQAGACGGYGARPVDPLIAKALSSNPEIANKAMQTILTEKGYGITFLEQQKQLLKRSITDTSRRIDSYNTWINNPKSKMNEKHIKRMQEYQATTFTSR